MHSRRLTLETICLTLLLMPLAVAAPDFTSPPQPTPRTLLLDHFDKPFTPDGKLMTSPALIKPAAELTGGRPMKGGEFVPGKFGNAFRLHDVMKMVYPAPGNLDLTAGAVEFWVAYNFDPAAKPPFPGLNVSNQVFFTVFGPGRSSVCIYSVLKSICVNVRNPQRQIVLYEAFTAPWKKGKWHHISLRWGRDLELWCDGEKRATKPWNGLFGPIAADPSNLRMQIGTWVGDSGVAAEFAIDELHILGPGGDQLPDHPILTIPFIAQPPTVDGIITPGEWDKAATTTGFAAQYKPHLVADQTIAHVAFDEDNLYVALELTDPAKRPVKGALAQRDAAVFTEDAFDIFLRPDPDAYPYYMLSANAIGTRFDILCRHATAGVRHEPGFNPDWQVRTSLRDEGGWIAEAAIPFAEIEGRSAPADGETWRVNICRDADAASRLSSWSFTGGNFHTVANFGEFVFRRDDRAIQLSQFQGFAAGDLAARVGMTGPEFRPIVTITSRILDGNAKPVTDQSTPLMDFKAVMIAPPPLSAGAYELTVSAASEDGRDLYYQRLPFIVEKAFDVTAGMYPYEGKLWVSFDVSGLQGDAADITAKAALTKGTEVLGTCQAARFANGRAEAAIDITDLPVGDYIVAAEAVGPDGTQLASAHTAVTQYERPPFWHSTAGMDDSVPEPWTPVVHKDDGTIEVWGREYQCAAGVLPRQILSQTKPLLSGPITYTISAAGETLDLGVSGARAVSSPDDRAIRKARLKLANIAAECITTTEFDGLMRCDLTLAPLEGKAAIDALTLNIPLRRDIATFMLPSTGRNSSARQIGTDNWQAAFHPCVWIGNDYVGLSWFAESDQHWQPRDRQMLSVLPQDDCVLLSLNMIRTPRTIAEPITISFGLHATPVKAIPRNNPFAWKMGGVIGGYQPDKLPDGPVVTYPEHLRYPLAGNVSYERGTLDFFLAPADKLGGGTRDVVLLPGGFSLRYTSGPGHRMDLTAATGPTAKAEALPFQLDTFTHVAITWGDATALYVDGKKVAEIPGKLKWADGIGKTKAPPQIIFGSFNEWRGYTRIALDEIRLSDTVRYTPGTFTPPAAPFLPDEHTLLLDHLDDEFRPDGEDAETRATKISGRSFELGGIPSIGSKFADGKFGKALQLVCIIRLQREVVKTQGAMATSHWSWHEADRRNPVHGWPPPLFIEPVAPHLKEYNAWLHDLGLRIVPYAGFCGIGAPSLWSRQFGAEWARRPVATQPAEPPKGHHFLMVCGNSGYADYMAAGTQWLMDKFGFDGIYTDGNPHVFPCSNTHHGCGYYDDEDILRPTWPILATRDYLKRMYKIIHANKPGRGFLVNHVSGDLLTPTLSFTDIHYTGEHEYYENLDTFRVRWQSQNIGVWTIMLGSSKHIYTPMATTYSLLHGVAVWVQGPTDRNDMQRKFANIWHLYDAFDTTHSTWLPYYEGEKAVIVPDHDEVKVSAYVHSGKRALLVIGNLSDEPLTPRIRLDLQRLGLQKAQVRAINALSGRRLPLDNEVLEVRVRPKSFVLALIE